VGASTIEALKQAALGLGLDHWAKNAEAIPKSTEFLSTAVIAFGQGRELLANIPIVGTIQVGSSRKSAEWPKAEQYVVRVPVSENYARMPVIGLELNDESMNQVYPRSTLIICVPYSALKRRPFSGERVVGHRRNQGGIETVLGQFFIDPNQNASLLQFSADPRFRQTILIGPVENLDSGDVAINLRVVGSYRLEPEISEDS
jgi:hypothetical protein